MRNWGFWEWVAYGCLCVGTLIMAAETGFKTEPEVMARLPDFFHSSLWGFSPAILVVFATGILIWREFFVKAARGESARAYNTPFSIVTQSNPSGNTNSSSDNKIIITSPLNRGVLEAKERRENGCFYFVRGRLPHLPPGHKIWVLNERDRPARYGHKIPCDGIPNSPNGRVVLL